MGKSALTWKWFNQIAPNEMKPLAGRLWRSFYESDADFEKFLIRALCYVSSETEDTVGALSWPEREARLLWHLNDKPYLFVLDGLERILITYHRVMATYMPDDEYDEQRANGVVGAISTPPSPHVTRTLPLPGAVSRGAHAVPRQRRDAGDVGFANRDGGGPVGW
jgi:hypothetical protein